MRNWVLVLVFLDYVEKKFLYDFMIYFNVLKFYTKDVYFLEEEDIFFYIFFIDYNNMNFMCKVIEKF